MLEAMRRGAQGIIAKALFAILILSFAVWGVADVFTGSSQTSIAEVGETPITPDEYQRAFQNELNALSYQVGRRISAEQARAFGLDERVLQRLIGSASVDVHARQLGLALSDQAIIDGLQRDPAFHGPDGKFSRDAVENVMRQLGLTEAGLIRLRRQEELRRHLTSALTAGSVVPRPMVEEMHAYREETLKRLEDEHNEFVDFLQKLREAKDKAEFDQFMQGRKEPRDVTPYGVDRPLDLGGQHRHVSPPPP